MKKTCLCQRFAKNLDIYNDFSNYLIICNNFDICYAFENITKNAYFVIMQKSFNVNFQNQLIDFLHLFNLDRLPVNPI